MIKRYFFIAVLLNFISTTWASAIFINNETTTFQQLLDNFSKVNINNLPGKPANKKTLPTPYDFLLTQPLMTPGIEKYYQRTPVVRTLYARQDHKKNRYSRIIVMLVDKNGNRNNPELAQEKQEDVIVETAVISMNFKELPEGVKTGVLNTDVPFGKLLVANKIKTLNKNQAFFSIRCNKPLYALTHCKLNNRIYGRINTIIRADNKKWLARVIEILPGITHTEINLPN